MAVRVFAANSENVRHRRRSSKRSFASIHDENAEAGNESAELCGRFGSQRRFSEPAGTTKASARRSRGLSDITNAISSLCLDLKCAEPQQWKVRHAPDVEMGMAERPCQSKRPVLPATLIAEILSFAGFAAEPMEAEYVERLLIRERQREPRFLAMLGWRAAPHARDRMRATTVDWLQEVHRNCGFRPRTLFLAVSLLDRFLERRELSLEHIQLAAAVALQLASKVDETKALKVRTIVWLCLDAYSSADVRNCEQAMLAALNFEVETPTVAEFLPVYLSACQAEANLGSLEHYEVDDVARCALRFGGLAGAEDQRRSEAAWDLCASSLLDAELCRRHPPSLLAAAAVLASNRLHGSRRPWLRSVEAVSGYSEMALVPCAAAMLRLRDPASAPEYCRRYVRVAI